MSKRDKKHIFLKSKNEWQTEYRQEIILDLHLRNDYYFSVTAPFSLQTLKTGFVLTVQSHTLPDFWQDAVRRMESGVLVSILHPTSAWYDVRSVVFHCHWMVGLCDHLTIEPTYVKQLTSNLSAESVISPIISLTTPSMTCPTCQLDLPEKFTSEMTPEAHNTGHNCHSFC